MLCFFFVFLYFLFPLFFFRSLSFLWFFAFAPFVCEDRHQALSAAGTHVSVRNAASLGYVPECLVSMVRAGGQNISTVVVQLGPCPLGVMIPSGSASAG